MAQKLIEEFLEKEIGLSAEAIGSETIDAAVRRRMGEQSIPNKAAYMAYVQSSPEEREHLIEAVVIPETWFFRKIASFVFLGDYVKTEWMPAQKDRTLRVLSIPCSTGEEPYSIAIVLLDAGLPKNRFAIDAVDISHKALHKAQQGIYGQPSFRGQDIYSRFQERYFDWTAQGYKIHDAVRECVRLTQGNILDPNLLAGTASYDVIFCRNLLIYLSVSARNEVIALLERLLAPTGLLFVGHAERILFQGAKFIPIQKTGVFAYRKAENAASWTPERGQGLRETPPFERRKQSKIILKEPAGVAELPPVAAPHSGMPPLSLDAIRHTPEETVTILDIARELADQGDIEEAMEVCKQVLKKDAAHVHANFMTGLFYQALRDEERAEEWFRKTVYLDPNHSEALTYLAWIVEQRGDREHAQQLRQRIQRIQQRNMKRDT